GFKVAAGIVAAVAVIAHAWRLAMWNPWKTLRAPLVWILHASYAWIVVHLALRALAVAGLVPATLAIHALTIGVIGGMTIGMMTRTARGHSGRPLVAGGAEVAAYSLVMAAALVRVFGGLLAPLEYIATVSASAACWTAAFAIYAVRYTPVLVLPRVDGQPG
ncbi:MAG TPA: NnrS family protein, partial [Usitatibacter sp.]|nr:NnrS family protein [Usitatibacter sp.]